MTTQGRTQVLVVGIGNPDRGDDGLSAAIISRLRGRTPDGVRLLARNGDPLALIDEWDECDAVILIDAAMAINGPGRIHRVDAAADSLPLGWRQTSSHAFGLAETIELARNLGRLPGNLVLYLVESKSFETGTLLSPAAANAVIEVVELILADLTALLAPRQQHEDAVDA
jgi:hydrogenase maturation protease